MKHETVLETFFYGKIDMDEINIGPLSNLAALNYSKKRNRKFSHSENL